jgi:5-methylcytosine-specific restriction endonuclease McrA
MSNITAIILAWEQNRQGFRCNLTGVPLTPDTASIDHIIPLSKGGSHTKANAQIILNSVNQAKGSMTQSEFVDMCRLVVEHFG